MPSLSRVARGCWRIPSAVVITINGTDHRLVLLDTNALSEFAKQGDSFRRFVTWANGKPMHVPCFSMLLP